MSAVSDQSMRRAPIADVGRTGETMVREMLMHLHTRLLEMELTPNMRLGAKPTQYTGDYTIQGVGQQGPPIDPKPPPGPIQTPRDTVTETQTTPYFDLVMTCMQDKTRNISITEVVEKMIQMTDPGLLNKLKKKDDSELIALAYATDVTVGKIKCMEDTVWLGSETIVYFTECVRQSIGDRAGYIQRKSIFSPTDPRKKIFITDTYFYAKLAEEEGFKYSNVRRWTRKADLFHDAHLLIIPTNENNQHWYLLVIDFVKKEIRSYDSLHSSRIDEKKNLLKWLQFEYNDKVLQKFADEYTRNQQWCEHDFKARTPGFLEPLPDANKWKMLDNCEGVMQQHNGCDCGVFTCLFVACVAFDYPLAFHQGQIQIVRKWMTQVIYNDGLRHGTISKGFAELESAELESADLSEDSGEWMV